MTVTGSSSLGELVGSQSGTQVYTRASLSCGLTIIILFTFPFLIPSCNMNVITQVGVVLQVFLYMCSLFA